MILWIRDNFFDDDFTSLCDIEFLQRCQKSRLLPRRCIMHSTSPTSQFCCCAFLHEMIGDMNKYLSPDVIVIKYDESAPQRCVSFSASLSSSVETMTSGDRYLFMSPTNSWRISILTAYSIPLTCLDRLSFPVQDRIMLGTNHDQCSWPKLPSLIGTYFNMDWTEVPGRFQSYIPNCFSCPCLGSVGEAMARLPWLLLLCLYLVVGLVRAEVVEKFLSRSGHTNNWAVLVSTSRFWFNYRVPLYLLVLY